MPAPGRRWRIPATPPSGEIIFRRRSCWKRTLIPTLFLYLVNGELEGVFAFILGPDPTYARIEDGKWLNDTLPYGTIHRLASAGRHPGVAAAVITWCLEHCESLRADTHADNKIMQHLLEENGFTKCGIIHVEDGTPRIAYQKMSLTLPLRRD